MKKKTGFLLGLLLGGAAAVVAFKRLDPAKRQKLVNSFDRHAANLKDKAVDYAFYANDAMNDASGQVHKGANGAKRHAKVAFDSAKQQTGRLGHRIADRFSHDSQNGPHFSTAADHLRSQLNKGPKSNDIVIDATRNFNSDSVVCYPDGSTEPF